MGKAVRRLGLKCIVRFFVEGVCVIVKGGVVWIGITLMIFIEFKFVFYRYFFRVGNSMMGGGESLEVMVGV